MMHLLIGVFWRKEATIHVLHSTSHKVQPLHLMAGTSAGTSPTFWTRGLAILGLAGTRGLASPIEDLPSFKMSPSLSRSEQ